MTVYADNMRGYARVNRGGRTVTGQWSHLLADDPDELAACAAGLGLRPEWLQSPGTPREHYDIVEAVRRRALAAGAVPIYYPRGTGNLIATKRLQVSALNAVTRGWHVFPLRPGLKTPALRDWENEASTDPERIRDLWTVRLQRDGWHVPEPRNVGIACGPSGLVVLDLDRAKPHQDRAKWPVQWRDHDVSSGADVLAVLAKQVGQSVPDTYLVSTPSGGRHLYFAAPEGVVVRNSTGRLGPMIDVRGKGGYVVAAGSRLHPRRDRDDETHETDEPAYRLTRDIDPVELPGWLIAVTTGNRQRDDQGAARPCPGSTRNQSRSSPSASYGAAALRGEADRVRSAPVGQRNHTLNAAAYRLGQLVAAGALEKAGAVQALTDAAADADLEAAEISSTIDSGLAAGLKQPRALPEHRSPTERSTTAGHPDETGLASQQELPPGGPDPLTAEAAPAEAPRNTPDPHMVLDAAIEQARAAVTQLEATRAGAHQPTYTRASDVAVRNDRPAGWTEPKVAP